MFREICEGYFKTPGELENMTLDQLFIMGVEKDILGGRRTVTGTPEMLYAQGLLKERPYAGGLSLVGRMQRDQQLAMQSGKSKRQRRKERRALMIAERE